MSAARPTRVRVPLAKARANALKLDWSAYQPPRRRASSARARSTATISPNSSRYIDWTPFFQTWELKGRYPAILDDPKQGAAARALFDDAQAMLKQIIDEKLVRAARRWSASGRRRGTATTSSSSRTRARERRSRRSSRLRQQLCKRDGKPNVALADFVARATGSDYIGAFVVTAGIEDDAIAERFEHANDDYSSILVKALADRFAEALAEAMHARVRRELWGYAPDEAFTPEELIGEPYRGIRPAPGYPAQPDHTEKATLFRLLDAERATGVTLTESFAMWPASSVSAASISPTRRRIISASPRSSATRSRIMPRARA